jgi:hypothetical protein
MTTGQFIEKWKRINRRRLVAKQDGYQLQHYGGCSEICLKRAAVWKRMGTSTNQDRISGSFSLYTLSGTKTVINYMYVFIFRLEPSPIQTITSL